MNIKRKERGQYPIVQTAYLPMPCMHCDEAPCLTADGAVYKRPDGLVIIDPVKAKGRNEEKELAQKCTGCAHLLDDGWTETRCSQVCPTEAIKLVIAEEDDVERMVEEEGLQRYRDSLGTKPRVYYKNLHRWDKAFVGCSVVYGDTDECAEGATVTVLRDGSVAGHGTTDIFGEVAIDHLSPGHEYHVRIEADGYKPAELTVQVDASLTAGTVMRETA